MMKKIGQIDEKLIRTMPSCRPSILPPMEATSISALIYWKMVNFRPKICACALNLEIPMWVNCRSRRKTMPLSISKSTGCNSIYAFTIAYSANIKDIGKKGTTKTAPGLILCCMQAKKRSLTWKPWIMRLWDSPSA